MAEFSVVVPAHDEAQVIGRLLDGLASVIDDGRAEVVVVANGCSDETAAVAARAGVTVVELDRGHKPSALNSGDAVVSAFPRFYVDGDVVLGSDDLVSMARRLSDPGVMAVAPRLRLDTTNSSRVVRSYHRYWEQLPAVRDSLAGRGCFGVTAAGRRRWELFPDVVADDQFVNSRFDPSERIVDQSVESIVRTPADLGSLIERKRRSHRGNLELERMGLAGAVSNRSWIRVPLRDPMRTLDLPAFLWVTAAVRRAARRDARRGTGTWGADRSSRVSS